MQHLFQLIQAPAVISLLFLAEELHLISSHNEVLIQPDIQRSFLQGPAFIQCGTIRCCRLFYTGNRSSFPEDVEMEVGLVCLVKKATEPFLFRLRQIHQHLSVLFQPVQQPVGQFPLLLLFSRIDNTVPMPLRTVSADLMDCDAILDQITEFVLLIQFFRIRPVQISPLSGLRDICKETVRNTHQGVFAVIRFLPLRIQCLSGHTFHII